MQKQDKPYYIGMKKILTLLFSFFFFNVYSQSSDDLGEFIEEIDFQEGSIRSDTSKLSGWTAVAGSYEQIVYIEFKVSKNKELLRILVEKPGKERILYYFDKEKLIGAKIEFSQEYKSWAGKSILIHHAELKPQEVVLSSPDDESKENVSQVLGFTGNAWKSYFQKK